MVRHHMGAPLSQPCQVAPGNKASVADWAWRFRLTSVPTQAVGGTHQEGWGGRGLCVPPAGGENLELAHLLTCS